MAEPGARFPAVLEAMPYRKDDNSLVDDSARFGFLAGHGYVGVRMDLRGSGTSTGVLEDEYAEQEQLDICEVIEWLSRQPWCTGDVGMTGISWSGFNCLQVAARRPPALRTVVSVHSTDDRYDNDVHHLGGSLLAFYRLQWAHHDARQQHPPAGPRRRRRRLAGDVAGPAAPQPAPGRALDPAPAPRRPLAARLGLRGLRGDRGAGAPRRRLAGPLHRRGLPAARGARPGQPRAGRAVVAHLARAAGPRAGDRLPAGVGALVRPLAQGRRQRRRRRPAAALLPAGLGAGRLVPPGAAGDLVRHRRPPRPLRAGAPPAGRPRTGAYAGRRPGQPLQPAPPRPRLPPLRADGRARRPARHPDPGRRRRALLHDRPAHRGAPAVRAGPRPAAAGQRPAAGARLRPAHGGGRGRLVVPRHPRQPQPHPPPRARARGRRGRARRRPAGPRDPAQARRAAGPARAAAAAEPVHQLLAVDLALTRARHGHARPRALLARRAAARPDPRRTAGAGVGADR